MQDSTADRLQLLPESVRKQWTTLPVEAQQFWTITRAYTFRFDGDELIRTFVQWAADAAWF